MNAMTQTEKTRSLYVRLVAALVLCAPLVLLAAAPAHAQSQEQVTFEASIDGQTITEGERLALDPDKEPTLVLSVTNDSTEQLGVRSIRLVGQVLGATFYSYDTAIRMELAPGETQEREFTLDLFALKGQATGLIPSTVALIDLDRDVIAGHDFVADVRGSLRSTYAYFGLGIAFLTLIGLFNAIKNLVTDELSESRWARAGTFALPGTGLGLSIVFTLSALRVFVPTNSSAGLITVLLATGFFVLGYLTPNPKEDVEGQAPPTIRLESKPPAPPARQPESIGDGKG